jgi:prepilin-type N-terminal cleavage/methylation domain-containing protein
LRELVPPYHLVAPCQRRRGYTLIEILVATALTLIVLAAVVQVFGTVSESISDARSFVEKVDQLRIAQRQLKQDLEGVTAYMTPPLAPELGLGYFEYVEGPLGPVLPLWDQVNSPPNPAGSNLDRPVPNAQSSSNYEMDSTQGDVDDVLMFTTRSRTLPFVGRIAGVASQSQLAEVAWFVRGRTLYRRVLLVAPQTPLNPPATVTAASAIGFYGLYDLSARYDPVQNQMVANTLSDLTRPENRFAHLNGFAPSSATPYLYPPHPHNVSPWLTGLSGTTPWSPGMKLPTLCESTFATASTTGDLSKPLPTPPLTLLGAPNNVFDAWRNPHPFSQQDYITGNLSAYYNANRVSEDVIMTNVIGFDVKAWDPTAPIITNSAQTAVLLPGDPGYIALLSSGSCGVVGTGAYVDLNYLYAYRKGGGNTYSSTFSGSGDPHSGLQGTDVSPGPTTPACSVYDTWCTRFENYNGFVDKSHDGFDDGSPNIGVVDAGNKKVAWPPYPTPLRGIQVKIRVYEPDSRQVREVTVAQSFLNE